MPASPSAVRAYYDSEQYLARNPIISVRSQLVSELLADTHDSRILDLGCGDGSVSRPLLANGNHLTLVDFSAAMLERARKPLPIDAPVEFVEHDVLSYKPPHLVDVVMCVGVLAHVPSPESLIAHIASLVRPQGLCVVQITDGSAPLGRLLARYGKRRCHEGWRLNAMTREGIVATASRHGLVEIRSRRYGLLIPGLGHIPYSVTSRLEAAVATPPLSRVGAELLIVFRRDV